MLVSLIIFGVVILALCGFLLITNYRLGKIPAMTFKETLEYVTKKDSKTIITVGMCGISRILWRIKENSVAEGRE